jgi:hypothetical protein
MPVEDDDDGFEEEELRKFQIQLGLLRKKTQSQEAFPCRDIQAVMRDKDELKQAIKNKEAEMDRAQ